MQKFSLDHLTPTQFEEFCYDLLHAMGFVNLNWRKGTGYDASPSDQGRDIECERHVTDVDKKVYIERWFVECKHYKQGVPPDKFQGAFAWANAERPHKLLLIASNFLSNDCKRWINSYKSNNTPTYQIKEWERVDLENHSKDLPFLRQKYAITIDNQVNEIIEFISAYTVCDDWLEISMSMWPITNNPSNDNTPDKQTMWKTWLNSSLNMWEPYKSIFDISQELLRKIQSTTFANEDIQLLKETTIKLDELTNKILTYTTKDITDEIKQKFKKLLAKNLSDMQVLQTNKYVFIKISFNEYDSLEGERSVLYAKRTTWVNLTLYTTKWDFSAYPHYINNPVIKIEADISKHITNILKNTALLWDCKIFEKQSYRDLLNQLDGEDIPK